MIETLIEKVMITFLNLWSSKNFNFVIVLMGLTHCVRFDTGWVINFNRSSGATDVDSLFFSA